MNSVLNEQRNVYPSIYNIYTPASLMNLLSFFGRCHTDLILSPKHWGDSVVR